MASLNKVQLIGNCGRDPEIRYLPSGQAVANISIATSTRRKDQQTGQTIEDTQWHRVTFYDRLAEIAGEYVNKGDKLYVEGRLKYGKYIDNAGVEKNTCDIVATSMQLLGSPRGQGGQDDQGGQGGYDDGGGQQRQPQQRQPQQQRQQAPRQGGYPQGGQQGGQQHGNRPPPRTSAPARNEAPRQAAPRPASGFDDMDDDIPF